MPALPTSEIERVFREEYGRAVAVLVRLFGDIDIAEEAVQDAFTAAVQSWPSSGLPPSPVVALVDGLDLDGYHLFHAIRAFACVEEMKCQTTFRFDVCRPSVIARSKG
jgi:hypothetical protein